MKHAQKPQRDCTLPSGFTLVELLVAVTIFIILTTLTIATLNYNLGSEQVTAASRSMQAMLEGAKSRAFGLSGGQRKTIPVGIRFILDENNPQFVKGLTYVQGSQETSKGVLEYVEFSTGAGTTDAGIRFLNPIGADSRSWKDLAELGLLRGGTKIKIGATNTKTFTISSNQFLRSDYGYRTLRLVEGITDVSVFRDMTNPSSGSGQQEVYEFDFSAVAEPMQGMTVEQFPPGVVIDLSQSRIPKAWSKIGIWLSSHSYEVNDQIVIPTSDGPRFAMAIQAGTSGGSQPDFASAGLFTVVTDNSVRWQIFPELQLDIMFSPQGTLMGKVVAEGMLHFVVTERIDAQAVFENDPTAGGGTTVGIAARDLRDRNGDDFYPDHQGSFRIITINPNSGSVTVSPVDFTDSDNDGWADDIFNLAMQGAEAK